MPMWNWWNRLAGLPHILRGLGGDRRGSVVVEFALFAPFLLLLLAGTVEAGRAYFQANAVEKGVRAGALFASRTDAPASGAVQATVENLVKTGTMDGSGPYLVPGWALPGATLDITITGFAVGTDTIPVIRVEAAVPWDPVLPGLLTFVGLSSHTIKAHHEQAYVGN